MVAVVGGRLPVPCTTYAGLLQKQTGAPSKAAAPLVRSPRVRGKLRRQLCLYFDPRVCGVCPSRTGLSHHLLQDLVDQHTYLCRYVATAHPALPR